MAADRPAQRHKVASARQLVHIEQPARAQREQPGRPGRLWHIEQVRGRGDREVWRLATLQRGLVLREQLIAAGIGRGAIAHRLAGGRLVAVHRGVYRVGHQAPVPFVRELAAALLHPGLAVLSHFSAAAVWGLCEPDEERPVQLTLAGRRSRPRRGVRIHHTAQLDPWDVRLRDGLPVTSPERTVIDLAAAGTGTLERALSELRVRQLASDRQLWAAIARCPNRRGTARLRAALRGESTAEEGFTRNLAEQRLRTLVRHAQLPGPRYNRRLHGYELDAVWEQERLALELDGFGAHGHRGAFERDRRRDQRLAAAGYTVMRVTWRQLIDEPTAVAVRLGQALALSRAPRRPEP